MGALSKMDDQFGSNEKRNLYLYITSHDEGMEGMIYRVIYSCHTMEVINPASQLTQLATINQIESMRACRIAT